MRVAEPRGSCVLAGHLWAYSNETVAEKHDEHSVGAHWH